MISVVIINYNSFVLSCGIIKKLSNNTDINIFIVDNSGEFPDDGLDLKNVFVLKPGANLGYAAGVNFGIRQAMKQVRSKFVVVMNPDVDIEESALLRMREILKKLPQRSLLSCKTHYEDGFSYNSLKRVGLRTIYSLEKEKLIKSDLFNGCLFMLRMDDVGELLFTESLFMYFEEIDFVLTNPDFTCYFSNEIESRRKHNPRECNALATFYTVRNLKILATRHSEVKKTDLAWFLFFNVARALKMVCQKGDFSLVKAIILGIYNWRLV